MTKWEITLPTAAEKIMFRSVATSGALIVASMPVAYTSLGVGFALVLAGISWFALSNYTAYRVGARNYVIKPYTAAVVALVSAALTVVALTSVIFS